MKNFTLISKILILLSLVMLLTGCAAKKPPAALPNDIPLTWTESSPSPTVKDLPMTASLLDLIKDPALTAIVKEALENNPDLKATAARLKSSGFLLSQTGSRRLPDVSLSMNKGRNNLGVDAAGKPRTKNQYRVSAIVSWEIDLWGKLSDQHRSARANLEAQTQDYTKAYDSLAARVIQAWIRAIATNQTLGIERQRQKALEKIETALVHRYREGLGDLEDYSAARTRSQLARANFSVGRSAHKKALRALEVLMGKYPRAREITAKTLPSIDSAPVMPPASVLKNRPDIQAALARIDAGNLTALAAQKDRLPALRLVSELSKTSVHGSSLDTADRLWSLAAGLTQPIFQGGRLKDEAQAQTLKADAAVHDLAMALLRAMKEVEDTRDMERGLARQEASLGIAAQEAAKTTAFFMTRYRKGLVNIQNLLIAQEQEMNIKTQLTDIKASRMTNRIDMALALGLGV